MYDVQTLKMDNADIRGKFNALEKDNDELNSKHSSLIKCHQEIIAKKNETIFQCQRAITELECMVNRLKAQSEDKTRQATAEVALKYETRNSELQQKVDQITSSLDKEKATCEKYRVELKESLKRQIEILDKHQKFKFRPNSDTNVRLNQPNTALDETTKALHHLQQEYIDLGKRHSDISSEYRELLKTHRALQLSYAKGNPRPVFSPPPYIPIHL
ncbi:hypothetical protein D5F01_LYC09343 [Larimichthys crocea]|uniref:Uncharacterized protein n=1 Tax=Larimichthys crocea TaxID=215358 RepID=A0A6G0IKM6_LARCR|nr:hypothetical protein D5F01_LYC09343 [Larimichthys crocea]